MEKRGGIVVDSIPVFLSPSCRVRVEGSWVRYLDLVQCTQFRPAFAWSF